MTNSKSKIKPQPKKASTPFDPNSVNVVPEPGPESPKYTLLGQADAIEIELSLLKEQLDSLELVLLPIMGNSTSKVTKQTVETDPNLSSQLGAQLEHIGTNVRSLAAHVRSLIDRVELV